MMGNIFKWSFRRQHFWRTASFGEIAELYTSRTLRVIAMNIVSGFTSVYLYNSGYSLTFIVSFWLAFYIIKAPLSLASGFFVARFGPKHGILISNLMYVPAMLSLGLLESLGMVSIVFWGLFMAISSAMYHVCYMVDFSKVKNVAHAGKEIAFMNIFEKVAIGISPILGGVIALWYGLQIVILAAAVLFAVAALPLFWTIEPIRTHQKLSLVGFPWKSTISTILAQTGVGFDFVTTGIVWNLFIVIVIFPDAGLDVYAMLGFLSSVTIIAAIFASYSYGKLIDRNRGGDLLRLSVIANAFVHASRSFAATPTTAVGVNIANEVATMGYTMSFIRGVFDTADISGHRILYLSIADFVAGLGSLLACIILLICITLMGDINGIKIFFFFSAAFVLYIGSANFNLYRK